MEPDPSLHQDGRALLYCPSERPLVPRSYVANRAAEALSLAAIDRPSEIIVVTEKGNRFGEPVLAMNRHNGGVNAMFFDGHATWMSRGALLTDPCGEPWSGVSLMRSYPIPGAAPWHANCPN